MSIEITSISGMRPMSPKFMFRRDVFIGRLRWDLPSTDDLEIDQFDGDHAHYIIATQAGQCVACWRLLQTTGSYMLRDTFPQLLLTGNAPSNPDIWELSRFAVATEGRGAFGFGAETRAMFREAHKFAVQRGVSRYVTVTTIAIERLLRHAKVECVRLGEPKRIGDGMAVALSLSPADLGRAGGIEIQTAQQTDTSEIKIAAWDEHGLAAGFRKGAALPHFEETPGACISNRLLAESVRGKSKACHEL
jgi:acyl homoserine lactone synthase